MTVIKKPFTQNVVGIKTTAMNASVIISVEVKRCGRMSFHKRWLARSICEISIKVITGNARKTANEWKEMKIKYAYKLLEIKNIIKVLIYERRFPLKTKASLMVTL